MAALIRGKRYPANQGGKVDCESDRFVMQCKEPKRLSLEALSELCVMIEAEGIDCGKLGVVGAKVRRGAGNESPDLVVMTARVFERLLEQLESNARGAV